MLEQVKISPCATRFSETSLQEQRRDRHRLGVAEKPPSNSPGCHCASIVKTIITAVTISAALTKVSRTRAPLPAPKFCPAIGPAASAIASAGIWIRPSTRVPMPNPACAAAPKSRST